MTYPLSDHLRAFVDPVTGPIYKLDYMAIPIGSFPLVWVTSDGPTFSIDGSRFTPNGAGFGLSRRQCCNAAIGEVLERVALCLPASDKATTSTYHSLLNTEVNAIDPVEFAHTTEEWAEVVCDQRCSIPIHDQLLRWIPAKSIDGSKVCYVPEATVYFASDVVSKAATTRYLPATTSTGAACGSILENALLGGTLEVFERDAFQGTWYSKKVWPRVSQKNFGSIAGMIQSFENARAASVSLIDLSRVHGVPIALVFITSQRQRQNFGIGLSAGVSFEYAAQKAFYEAAALFYSGAHGEKLIELSDVKTFEDHVGWYQYGPGDPESLRWLISGNQEDNPSVISIADDESSDEAKRCQAIEYLVEAGKRSGISLYYVDTTPESWTSYVRTVKVISPESLDLDTDQSSPGLCARRLRSRWFREVFGKGIAWNLDPHPFP